MSITCLRPQGFQGASEGSRGQEVRRQGGGGGKGEGYAVQGVLGFPPHA